MRSHRLGDARGRYATGLAEIGRPEDRHVGDRTGVLDEIADTHDFAGHDCFVLERGRLWCASKDLRRAGSTSMIAGEAAANATSRIIKIPQRIRLEVADSIWSAAVMTLAFIS